MAKWAGACRHTHLVNATPESGDHSVCKEKLIFAFQTRSVRGILPAPAEHDAHAGFTIFQFIRPLSFNLMSRSLTIRFTGLLSPVSQTRNPEISKP
jgi:hypothetical protein